MDGFLGDFKQAISNYSKDLVNKIIQLIANYKENWLGCLLEFQELVFFFWRRNRRKVVLFCPHPDFSGANNQGTRTGTGPHLLGLQPWDSWGFFDP